MLHLSGNKMQKTANFVWSELKQLFTYSPIHLFTFAIPLADLGAQKQNGAQTPHFHQNWAYATKPQAASSLPQTVLTCCDADTNNYQVKLQRSFGTCSIVLEIKCKSGQLFLGRS